MPDSPQPCGFDTSFAALTAQLACPACYGELRMNGKHLGCSKCGRTYPIIDGIPVLIDASLTKP